MPPIVDLFSASSKPMPMVDSLPSQPLQFAATLRPIDLNAPSAATAKLPKPRRGEEFIPKVFPTPPYIHSRHPSTASIQDTFNDLSLPDKSTTVGTDEWMQQKVDKCLDDASGNLEITGLGLTTLSTKIADLRDLVTLPSAFSPSSQQPRTYPSPLRAVVRQDEDPIRPVSTPTNASSMSRAISAPASSFAFNNLQGPRASTFTRARVIPATSEAAEHEENVSEVSTAAVGGGALMASPVMGFATGKMVESRRTSMGRTKSSFARLNTIMNAQVFLGNNRLTCLPSALFEVSNITVLSLRGNNLKSIPAAIGALHNLKELNIGNNSITDLPWTILDLSLGLFTADPNPFLKQEADELWGPLVRHYDSPVRSLKDLCLSVLISPQKPNDLPPLLDKYYWDPPRRGVPHPLLDASAMHELIPNIDEADLERVLQLLRSCSNHHLYSKRHNPSGSPETVDPFPRSHRVSPSDDASTNPYYLACPSSRHLEGDGSSTLAPRRHLFVHPAEERIQWTDVAGHRLPVRWMGCSPGCLALEYLGEEEDWEFDGGGDEEITL
ncbi:hypothetical protein J010_05331 [Cryptococcus neoformans]|nr:hypothetical protein C355_00899 [Cryptococcus neoformans var. grubii Th84]OXH04230.1 hypothetical protein J010_05331 [Cryptococcus neoformans var. grubii]OXH26032.1 hypothetical protein J009_05333 [Cryptococcus neoformans var. grubii]OXH45808.1 hypothetical protein J004_05387 [Cryptococcus neoformans var. grubii]OXH46789.1 hypothetical protein J003_05279 [Cryptococcus neoformans var. grubii]